MTRFSRIAWSRSQGLYVLPPTLMVALGHPWLGSATLVVVLGASALQVWMVGRSTREQHRDLLAYAQNTTSMGGDPSPVIAALRGDAVDVIDAVDAKDDEPRRVEPPRSPWAGPLRRD